MSVQPFLLGDGPWMRLKDGDDSVRAIFDRHYSRHRYKDGSFRKLFVGPGYKIVLMTPDARAIFVWRKFIDKSGQKGVNCAVFRREPEAALASSLILTAEPYAWEKWPGERLYTYVDPRKIKSRNPGYCFKQAGWRECGYTKGGLLILEKLPGWEAPGG